MKTFVFTLLAGLATVCTCSAAPLVRPPVTVPLVKVDWQEPSTLPPRLRNHCATDVLSSRGYCSDHCGFQYQVYYCSPQSFGCCRIGVGYCDWNGLLRCHP
jgi:hypothetical protein